MSRRSGRSGFSGRSTPWRLLAALIAVLAALAATPAFGDGGHGVGSAEFDPATLGWGVASLVGVFALIAVFRGYLLRRAGPASEPELGFWQAARQFSPNARYFLTYSILAELGTGIWSVLFNLYLLRIGFPIAFVGTFWLVNMLCHGFAALPAGLIADRFGRRRAFVIATSISLLAQGSLLFTLDPTMILILAGIAGFGEAFHGVTGAPFMMENSEPAERPHLFSLNAAFLQISRFVGNLAGGALPLGIALTIGVAALDPSATRVALIVGLPLTLIALLPLAFMRERTVELATSFKELVLFRNVVHRDIVAKLILLSLLIGTGFGLTIRFFNIFFQDVFNAPDSQVGSILAFGAIASAASILISPLVAQHWGKARGLFITQALSVPFLLLMAVVPALSFVTTLFLVRGALYAIGGPLRNQLSMEFIAPRERGTTAGFTHTAFDLGGGLGAGVAGLLITDGSYAATFTVAALLILIPGYLYYQFFGPLERRNRSDAPNLTRTAVAS